MVLLGFPVEYGETPENVWILDLINGQGLFWGQIACTCV